jgi:hypothetical protein
MADQNITFRIDGPIIKDEYPLHEVIAILDSFHSILDQSYLVLASKNRMTRVERLNFRILSSRTQTGSLIQYLRLIYEVSEPLLPLFPQLTSPDIWKSAKAAFDFLKTVINLRRNGKKYTVSAPNNEGIIVLNSQGSAPVSITQNVFNIAERSLDGYKTITNQIEEGRIETISALDNKKEGIVLTNEERKLFNPEIKVEDNPVNVTGRIFDFNTEKLAGKLRVSDGQPVPARDYNFLLIGNQDFVPYIMAMTVPEVTLRCLPEIEQHPTGAKYIFRLQALSLMNK